MGKGAFSQNAQSLLRSYKESRLLTDPILKEREGLKQYADYALYQINDLHPSSIAVLDTLEKMQSSCKWNKALGIYLRVKARWYDKKGDMDAALDYYNQAVDTLRGCGPDYQDLSTAVIGAGFVLLNTRLYTQSFKTLKEGYALAKASGHIKNQWITLNFFGDYYYYSAFRKELFDSALYYYLKTDSLNKAQLLRGYFQCDNDLGLADVYRRLGQEDSSTKYWNRSLKIANEYKNYGVGYALYVDKAEVLENEGKYKEALSLKKEAYKYVQSLGSIELISRADYHLFSTYKNLGDYKNALIHYEKYIFAQDSMKKDAAAARYIELETKYKTREKEDEIIRLQNNNLRQSRYYLLLILALGTFLLGFITLLNLNLRKKNKELESKNKEILLAQLQGQGDERRRMATELHDNLNTKIAAIRWQLEAVISLTQDKVRRILGDTLQLVNDVYGDVRLISHNLMPDKVEAIGLIPALESLIVQLNQSDKVKFHLVINAESKINFASLTYPVYNIIFEMINNILKHAQAENGWISISADKTFIYITVSDDGRGFEVNQMTQGFGIRNITSRVDSIKGKWNIDSAPGKGTQFFIEIPRVD